jgi:lipopolysaccharide heptosyltransferase II
LGGPGETAIAHDIVAATGNRARDLTGNDLRDAIMALAAADVSVTNDSGLMHVSAAVGAPTVAIFGPTSPWHQKPLNPLAAILEPPGDEARALARAQGNDAVRNRRTADVTVTSVRDAVRKALP